MTWQHLAILLVVMAASDLATPEGAAAAAAAARETRPTALHAPGNGSRASGGTKVHVTGNTRRNPQHGNPTPRRQQQQEPASTPALQQRPRGRQIPGGEAGGQDSNVDTVLAALVDYSKDPKLWHFVHSVVDELDYSQRASHLPAPATPRHPRPALHLSRDPHTRYWRTAADGKYDTGQSDNHTHRRGIISEINISRNISGNRTTTTTTTAVRTPITATPTTATPLLPWLQQPPEEPYVSAERTQDYNTSTDMLSVTSSDRINFVKSLPSPSPHFLFHRVFIDKTFDSHTRQPYRRPVLALTAVETGTAKSEKDNLTSSASHTRQDSSHSDGTEELVDKFHSLSVNSAVPESSNKRKETSQDGDEEYGGGASESQDVLSNAHHHHYNHHHHHHHRLHTFKSQLKFLQRWEKRLWRQAHLQHPHATEGL